MQKRLPHRVPDQDADDVEEKMAEADLNARLAAVHDCGREGSASRANVGTQRHRQPEPQKMYHSMLSAG